MAKLFFLVIAIILLFFFIHNLFSSVKEMIDFVSALFIRIQRNKQIESICKLDENLTTIINSEIINQHVTYININLSLIQKIIELVDENSNQGCLNNLNKQIVTDKDKLSFRIKV